MTKPLLVDYASSSSESDNETEPAAKRRRLGDSSDRTSVPNAKTSLPSLSSSLPPLPGSFYSLYATNVRASTADDPALHGGRKRQVAHKEGNWPTHVYLEWFPSQRQEGYLRDIIKLAQGLLGEGDVPSQHDDDEAGKAQVHSLLRSDLDVQLPLHISLSAPLVLDTSQKEPFDCAVRQAVAEYGARAHHVRVRSLEWVSNFDKTRWFLVLKLATPTNNDLRKLLDACNGCARKFGLNELYVDGEATSDTWGRGEAEDCFHISIAWTLRDPTQNAVPANLAGSSTHLSHLRESHIGFDTVKLKIGNTVHDISLPPADIETTADMNGTRDTGE